LYCSVLVCREGWSAAYRCKVRSCCADRGAPHSRIVSRRRTVEQAGTVGRLPSMRLRRAWARAVQRLFEAFSGCSPWWQSPHPFFDFPPRLCREVIWACRPALLAIAAILVEERQPISATALRQLKRFLTEPSVSPLFGDDPMVARRAAQQLLCSFTDHPEVDRDCQAFSGLLAMDAPHHLVNLASKPR
jgi:hypothetical protein